MLCIVIKTNSNQSKYCFILQKMFTSIPSVYQIANLPPTFVNVSICRNTTSLRHELSDYCTLGSLFT
ncbi:hypothetical protein [Heliothis virescens ascovirus 3j]|uniref:Uncharacterized protein n=1 Tax=Heliothis virescens ascovirus 3j TaxID=1561067 RepID=A0A2Z5V6Y7_9VIRU|nr:hypothetical protein [Heliothis virescens ascovirus 3j]